MQPADPPAASGRISAPAAERFTARGTSGRFFVIEKLQAQPRENSLQGLEWSDGGPHYQLQGGGAVERLDESTFRIAGTGEELRREEGTRQTAQHRVPDRI